MIPRLDTGFPEPANTNAEKKDPPTVVEPEIYHVGIAEYVELGDPIKVILEEE